MAKDYENYATLDEYMNSLVASGVVKNKTEARKAAYRRIPNENYFQGRILKYLNSQPFGLRVKAWKNQAGMYQERGLPDVEAVVEGQYFGFEVKRPLIGKPTPLQLQVADEIRAAGGKVYFISYISEVEQILLDYSTTKKLDDYDSVFDAVAATKGRAQL